MIPQRFSSVFGLAPSNPEADIYVVLDTAIDDPPDPFLTEAQLPGAGPWKFDFDAINEPISF